MIHDLGDNEIFRRGRLQFARVGYRDSVVAHGIEDRACFSLKIERLQRDHIFANSSGVDSDSIEIPFSAVESIEEAWDMPGTIKIEYQTENGTMMQYSITILNPSDDLKAEGARDLDRLITLLEEQRDKSE